MISSRWLKASRPPDHLHVLPRDIALPSLPGVEALWKRQTTANGNKRQSLDLGNALF